MRELEREPLDRPRASRAADDRRAPRATSASRGRATHSPPDARRRRAAAIETPRDLDGLRKAVAALRRERGSIGLVPTMGAFHEGHVALMRAARRHCGAVVVSLFVNPTQFRPGEDFDSYPQQYDRDVEIAVAEGVDVLYAPSVADVYPEDFSTWVEVGGGLSDVLCGAPGRRGREHFRGVATVVAKLLNRVQPDVAFFGRKDAQQALIIERMVRDLDFPVRIEVLPTVRELDGLAISSRNARLGADRRDRATALSRALRAAEAAAAAGGSVDDALAAARARLHEAEVEVEYLEARDAERLRPVQSFDGGPVLVALAARFGEVRLIDNTVIGG